MNTLAQVTVVIPCYQCADTIDRAVASIAKQTLPPKEVVLVEDYSNDATLEKLQRLQASYPEEWIKVIALPQNEGPGTARNIGWDAATQPYVAFLDSDDAWHPQKIEIQYLWMQAHPEVALTGHECRYVQASDNLNTNFNFETNPEIFRLVSKARLLAANQFSTPSVMLRRELLLRFQYGKRYSEDYLLWCEICCSGLLCYRSELPLAHLFKAAYGAGGLSGDLKRMQEGQLDTYQHLYAKHFYGIGTLALLTSLSRAKYCRRLFKCKFLGFGASK